MSGLVQVAWLSSWQKQYKYIRPPEVTFKIIFKIKHQLCLLFVYLLILNIEPFLNCVKHPTEKGKIDCDVHVTYMMPQPFVSSFETVKLHQTSWQESILRPLSTLWFYNPGTKVKTNGLGSIDLIIKYIIIKFLLFLFWTTSRNLTLKE